MVGGVSLSWLGFVVVLLSSGLVLTTSGVGGGDRPCRGGTSSSRMVWWWRGVVVVGGMSLPWSCFVVVVVSPCLGLTIGGVRGGDCPGWGGGGGQGVIFFMTSCGWAFFTKNFL